MEIRAAFFGYGAFQLPNAEAKPALPHHGAPAANAGHAASPHGALARLLPHPHASIAAQLPHGPQPRHGSWCGVPHLPNHGLPQQPQLPGWHPPVRTPQGPMMVDSNTNTVDTGNYTIQGSKDTLTVTDKTTGESFKVWGDPHIQTSDGDKTDFMQKPATFMLPDGTKITVTPTKSDNPNAATFIDNVTITRGNDAAQMSGVHDGKLHTDAQRGQGRWLDAKTPDGTVLTAKNGHIKDLMLDNGTEIKGNNIKNIDQFAKPEQPGHTPVPMPKPLPHPAMSSGPFPPVLHPGWGASKPNHMGPFRSNLHPGWGVGMVHQMGGYLAAMFPKPVAGKPGMEPFHPTARHPEPFKVDTKTNTVDTGRYTLQASRGTLTVKDNVSGENFKVWNDPYIDTSDGDRTSFANKPATFLLPDGTKVTVTPTTPKPPETTDPEHPSIPALNPIYIDNVTITRGNDAVQINNVSNPSMRLDATGRLSQVPIETQVLRGQGRLLDAITPDGTVLTAKDGHIKDLVLENGTEIKGWNTIRSIENPTNDPRVTMQLWRERGQVI